jgi:hypothetical protein
VLDFDAAFRDPAKPTQMKEAFQAGDHLHGSDARGTRRWPSRRLEMFRDTGPAEASAIKRLKLAQRVWWSPPLRPLAAPPIRPA